MPLNVSDQGGGDFKKDRFLNYVFPITESGCWIWMGGLRSDGYGGFWLNGGTIGAHRASWILFNGHIPLKKWVLHRCDTPCCVNPAHLFLGSPQDNTRDMLNKRRDGVTGEKSHLHKICESDIAAIRKDKRTLSATAQDYGVTLQAIWSIKNNRSWKYVPSTKE